MADATQPAPPAPARVSRPLAVAAALLGGAIAAAWLLDRARQPAIEAQTRDRLLPAPPQEA